jgi:hypothetical protein
MLAVVVALALTVSPLPPPRASAEDAYTGVYLDGEVGEGTTGGRPRTFYTPTDNIDVHAEATEFRGSINSGAFNFRFVAPQGEDLVIGTYPDAVKPDNRQPGQAGIEVTKLGLACSRISGSFTLHEWTVESGVVTSAAISFQQTCGFNPALLYGEIRWNSPMALRAAELAPLSPFDFGPVAIYDPAATQEITLTATGTQPLTVDGVSLSGVNADDFAILGETCTAAPIAVGAACAVTVQAYPDTTGRLEATLVIDDDSFRGSKTTFLLAYSRYPVSAVGWGRLRAAPNWSWSTGNALARTVSSGTEWLHASYATDRIDGRWASDDGRRVGVYYARTKNGGASWSTPMRLNPTNVHGLRGSIAASGAYVYATWVSVRRWNDYWGRDRRVLYLRRNSGHGRSARWSANIQLSSSRGRVDIPTVAAAGTHVYVAYTNSVTGDITLKVSHDRGRTWATVKLGTTRFRTGDGYTGWPRVSASGGLVGVSWTAAGDGRVKARVSTNAGRSWTSATQVTSFANDLSSSAATSSRFAVSWTNGHAAQVRLWEGGAWSAKHTVPGPQDLEWSIGYSATVALTGADRLGVAWSACMDECDTPDTNLVNLIWTESTTDGMTWTEGQTISNWMSNSARRYADYPSIVWPKAGTRYMFFNAGSSYSTIAYRMYLVKGTGSP